MRGAISVGRIAAVSAVCVALATGVVAGTPRAVADSPSPLTVVMVSPAMNIVDGEPVQVAVTGFDTESSGTMAECGTAAGASSVTCLDPTTFTTDDQTMAFATILARSSLCQGPVDDSGCYIDVTGVADGQPATIDWPIPSVGPDFVPPKAQNLQLIDVTPDQIIMSWDAVPVGAWDRNFEWAVTRTGSIGTNGDATSATFENPEDTGPGPDYFNWGGLAPDTEYTITLTAQDWDGDSLGTLSETVTTPSPDQTVTADTARRRVLVGKALHIHGAVTPAHTQSLDLEQWRGGAWHHHLLRTNKYGRYTTTTRAVSGTTRVRVVALAKHGYDRATSRVIHLHVRH